MRIAYLIAAVGLIGCGDDGGSTLDGPVVPTTVTVTGTTYDVGLGGRTPIGGVSVQAFEEGGTTAVAMTTSAADGTYTLSITTNGSSLDGYVLGKLAGKKDNYLYPAGPLTADISNATVLMLSQSIFDASFTIAQVSPEPGKGWIGVQVYDGANAGVAGVTVSTQPAGTVKYNGANGLPTANGTATMADGIAYVFNVGPGDVTISASGGGQTFRSHRVNARADQVTTTLVQS
jgi:hypothetical protein